MNYFLFFFCVRGSERVCVCVCMCVCFFSLLSLQLGPNATRRQQHNQEGTNCSIHAITTNTYIQKVREGQQEEDSSRRSSFLPERTRAFGARSRGAAGGRRRGAPTHALEQKAPAERRRLSPRFTPAAARSEQKKGRNIQPDPASSHGECHGRHGVVVHARVRACGCCGGRSPPVASAASGGF